MSHAWHPAWGRKMLLIGTAVALVAVSTIQESLADGDGIETVTVTASKRTTDLQSTPMAISVLSGDQLDAQQINTTNDLQLHVPGFVMSTNVIQGEAYIRGIGTDISSISADPSVAFMIDGVYLPRLSTSLQDLYDVERVEVLKGPQGTLYGRDATGGVVNIITKLPSDTLEADADALFGNYGEQRYRVSVSGPLSDGVAARISAVRHVRDGYVDNLELGGTVDPQDTWAARGSIEIQPGHGIDIVLSADYSNDRGAPSSAVYVLSNDAPALFFGGTVTSNPYKIYENLQNKIRNEQGGVSGKLTWDLGDVVFSSLTAYRDSQYNLLLDLDGTEVNWFIHDPDTQSSNTVSQEFQLASKSGGNLDWLAGFYFFHENADSNYNLFLPLFSVNVNPVGTNITNAYAVYGEGTYHVTEKFSLTAGLRYSDEQKSATVVSQSYGVPLASFSGSKSWNAVTPKFGAQYQLDSSVMLYASATRGFKSGGFNSTAIQTPQDFDPEYVWSYEAGMKSTLMDGKLLFNVDGFYYDYTDLQVNKYDAVNIVTLENAAKATIKGLEVEAAFKPIRQLTLSANLSFLDPTYDQFTSVDPDNGAAGPIDLSGNQLVRAPKFTANLSAQYSEEIASLGTLTGRTSYFYRSRIYFTPFNSPGVSQEGFGLWNASLQFDTEDGRWSVTGYINNIGNKLYYQEMARSASIVGTIGWPGVPRTFGASIAVHL